MWQTYTNRKRKNLKRDVGMACQKRTQTRKEDIKVNVNIRTNPHPCIFLTLKCNCSIKDVGMDKALYIYLQLYILPSLFIIFCMPSPHLLSFLMIFLFLSVYIFGDVLICSIFSVTCEHYIKCNHNPIT